MEPPARAAGAPSPGRDEDLEKALRPRVLDDFIGQQKIKDNLRVFLAAALQRGETLDHVLLSGPPGLGKCITPDSLVLTREGWIEFASLIPAGMAPGESRPVSVEVQGALGLEPASHIYCSGRVPTVRVRTRSGFEIEGTPHHPVLVASSAGPVWKPLGRLTPADAVALSRGARAPGREATARFVASGNASHRRHAEACTRLAHAALSRALGRAPAGVELRRAYAAASGADARTPLPMAAARRLGLPLSDGRRIRTAATLPDIPALDPGRTIRLGADLAYLLGALVGDGHATATGGFVLTCAEPQMQREAERITEGLFGRPARFRHGRDRSPNLRLGADIGRTLAALGLRSSKAADKTVPDAVLSGSPAVATGFLQGLFDADGHARADGVELGTRSAALARQAQLLLLGLGIVAYRKCARKAGAPFWTLFIGGADAVEFYRSVGFRLSRKQARAAELPPTRGWSRSDLVPGAAPLLAEMLHATGPHPRSVHKAFGHAVRGDRTLSRQKAAQLSALLPARAAALPQATPLAALLDPRLVWDSVATSEPGEAEAYDFVVPGTHTFVANGIVNHNTSLAYIVAEEMGAAIKTTSGPALDKPASIAGLLTNLNEGDVLFIDEIHRLSPVIEEYLYSAMEDYAIDILIDSGPSARSVRIALPAFTLIGATTRKGLLTAPLRARFGIDFRYETYSADLLQQIVLRSSALLRVEIDPDGAFEIARRSRGTPRIANRLLRRTRDFAEVQGSGRISRDLADHALDALDVDEAGLDDMDARLLLSLMEKFDGGPVGLGTLAVAVGEDAGTVEEVYEPFLIQEGFLARTPRGRVATRRAYAHFGVAPPLRDGDLFEPPPGGPLGI